MDTSETLSELLNQMAPLAPLGVNKETYVTTSGITCLGMIYDALRKIFPPNLSEDKPIAVFGNSCYYQLVESDSGLKNCMNEYFKCEVQSFVKHSTVDNIDKKRIAVLVLDQLPNRVVLPEVAVIEIEKIVKDILKEPRDPNFPLVLIVDCATTLLMHQDIQDLVNNLSEYIQEGQLILIPTNSFIKFMLCGLDAYSGGAIEVFSSKQHKNAEALERHLKVASGEDALSVEASRIFHLVIKYAKEQILEYHQTITSNTHSIYQKFEEHQLTMKEKIDVNSTDKDKKIDWQSPIQVAIRSKEIPMIGLHFNYIYHQIFPKQEINSEKLHIIVLVMQYLLFAKLSKSHLLITIKQSFGFFEPNLIECWEALRFTLGLSEENLQAYATIILEVNDALKKSLSSQQMCSELAEKIEFLANIKNLSKRIGQVHATIMTAKEGFEGILEFFFSKVKQLENQNL